MGWYIVGAGLVVIGVAGLVFGSGLASANQKIQGAMWGRTSWTGNRATRYNAGKTKTVGGPAVSVGAVVPIARRSMH